MLDALGLSVLVPAFVVAAGAVWISGIRLSEATDVLSERFGLGQALGGLLFLAVTTNLPEIAITVSAALGGDLGIAIGNILGGIAIQTVVLDVLDVFGVRGDVALTYLAASLVLVLEGTLVVAVLVVAIMGSQLPSSFIFERVAPGGLLIAVLWVAGVLLLARARSGLPWQERGEAPGGQEEPRGVARSRRERDASGRGVSTARGAVVLGVASAVTLVAGVALEQSGEAIAGRIGMSGVLFGSTVLAAATALPEVSTGLASVRLRDYQLAMSDIFGGNAFLPVLFLAASVISGQAVLPQLRSTDIYLTGLGILLTTVYVWGLIFRPRRQVLGMGLDSLVVLVLYLLGVVGLIVVTMG